MSGAGRRPRASLAIRLIGAALVWMLLLLGAGGVVLTTAFRQSAVQEFSYRLEALLRAMIAVTETAPDGSVTLVRSLGDPRFEQVFSGWYWQVAEPSGRLIRSRSLWDSTLPVHVAGAEERREITGPKGEPLLAVERDLRLPGSSAPVHMIIAGDLRELNDRISDFNRLLYAALLVFAAGMAIAVIIQVRFGLQPLRRLTDELSAIKNGARQRLGSDYPREVAPLAEAMNAVLDHDSELIERARTHVGNLAHGLKTPLAILQTELHGTPDRAAVEAQLQAMTRLIEHHLTRAAASAGSGRALGSRCLVRPVVVEIAGLLARIQSERGITAQIDVPDDAAFFGSREDLQEMAGNLLENAWKWARTTIRITANTDRGLTLTVEDDGPGLTPEQAAAVSKRGVRLDEKVAGWGLGLGIVTDLAELNGGRFAIKRSALGGARAILDFTGPLPAA